MNPSLYYDQSPVGIMSNIPGADKLELKDF